MHIPSTNLTPNSTSNCSAGPSNSSSSKSGRGIANGIPIWGTGEKFQIEFDKNGLPIGKCDQPFIGQLGLLARNGFKVPLTYARWNDLPNDVLDGLWREVQDTTNAPPAFRNKCSRIVGQRWKEWKHYVKRHNYDIYKTDEERLSIVPDRVVADQWMTLVRYWGQDAIKSISFQNSINREFLGGNHKMGRSSFRSIRRKMEVEGITTDRLSVFTKTRTNKQGIIDGEAKEKIDEVNYLVEKLPEAERTTKFKDDCFLEVMGMDGHGRVRTYGSGVGYSESSEEVSESIRLKIQEEVQSKFEAQITQMKAQIDQMTQFQQNMQAHLERVGLPLPSTMLVANNLDNPSIPSSTGQVGDENDASADEVLEDMHHSRN